MCGVVCVCLQDEDEFIGFATLPDQVHRKAVRRGFDFTLMVVGQYPPNSLPPSPSPLSLSFSLSFRTSLSLSFCALFPQTGCLKPVLSLAVCLA